MTTQNESKYETSPAYWAHLVEDIQSGKANFKDMSWDNLIGLHVYSGGHSDDFDKYEGENIKRMRVIMALKKKLSLSKGNENYQELVQGFQTYVDGQSELCPDNQALMEILPSLLKLQNDKGRVYGRSYAKHGDVSIFLNVERKFDRIGNIMDRAMREGTDTLHSEASATATETFLDTVVDLGLYALMWAGYIKEMYPQEWERFLTANKL